MDCSWFEEHEATIVQVLRWIVADPGAAMDATSLADRASYSQTHLRRVFRLLVGESIGSFVRRARLEFGAERLTGTSDSIAQIAEACGYESSQGFIRAFRKMFDGSPAEFRALNIRSRPHFPTCSYEFFCDPLLDQRREVGIRAQTYVVTLTYEGAKPGEKVYPWSNAS